MLDLTFLSEKQVFGDDFCDNLNILKKYGTKCAITDFAILLGGYVSSDYHTEKGNSRKDRVCWWWTKDGEEYHVRGVSDEGFKDWCEVNGRSRGIRPTFTYSSIQSIFSNGVKKNSGIKEGEYGEYPQWVVDENYSRELERVYNNGSLRTTGKNYTTDSVDVSAHYRYTPFKARTHTEYEYKGSKYIRFVGDSNCDGEELSDGRTVASDEPYWIKVEPIIWLVDEKAGIALSKYIILSGIQFDDIDVFDIYEGNFQEAFIKKFMDTYLAKEIECSVVDKLIENKENKSYDFDSIFEDAIKKMNEINEVEKTKKLSLK